MIARRITALLLACGLAAGTAGCGVFSEKGRQNYNADRPSPGASGSTSVGAAPVPFDVRPLLHPAKKYLGLATDGAPDSMAPASKFASMIGKQPNLVEYYSAWGDGFDTQGTEAAWSAGALPYMAWEPKTTPLTDIAAGKSDSYIKEVATAIRDLDQPIAISFGHEMNGLWTPWGVKHYSAATFVAAWRHIHDVFQQVGATSVIWVWSPNQTNIAKAPLKPLWPGDGYADWIGIVGYYGQVGKTTFKGLFQPTVKEIRAFTKKPVLLAETAAPPGARKPADIKDLFTTIGKRPDLIGFIWFNYHKPGRNETDWRVESDKAAEAAFRTEAANPKFGFDPRSLK